MKRSIIAILFAGVVFICGCNDDYFTDGGLPDEKASVLNVSTLDYLDSQKGQFDTLATLIKLCGLEAEVNKPGNTFLAPQNYSIHNYFKLLFPEDNWPPLTALTAEQKEEIAGIIRNYIIPDKQVERSGLSPAYSYETTRGGTKARFNLIREDYLENVNMGAAYLVFGLNVGAGNVEQYRSVIVVTSGLRSTNGIIHVLDSNTHIFGFN
ncbi:fasciclin domain-containing protein [Dyadobacter bucti]|jgi:hypothetical protein|uniref:fasciclin domain-containing protein n=1 Tax=Dyadobacter bucti TaxID=2572203 RepID=UPI001107F349|nr:fasciclin domain-containing protein [Dyadobacter bucti]